MNFRVSAEWDDTRTLDEMIEKSKFAFFYKKKDSNALPGDGFGRPHLVFEETKTGLVFSTLEDCGAGLIPNSDGISGHEFISEAAKTFDLLIFKDTKECIAEYLRLNNLASHILS